MSAFWEILHGLFAIALIGAITHQGLATWRRPKPAESFVDRFRAVPAARYANAIVVLYVTTFALGAWIYPMFAMQAKPDIIAQGFHKAFGVFQLKEHLAAMGLILLPVYLQVWRAPPGDAVIAGRRFLTTFLMLGVWWNLVVGHVINNIKGLA